MTGLLSRPDCLTSSYSTGYEVRGPLFEMTEKIQIDCRGTIDESFSVLAILEVNCHLTCEPINQPGIAIQHFLSFIGRHSL